MAQVFTNQTTNADSTAQKTGSDGQFWVETEGGFGGGTVAIQKLNPDGNYVTVVETTTALTFTAPFAIAVNLHGVTTVRLNLSGATGATLDAWITPLE